MESVARGRRQRSATGAQAFGHHESLMGRLKLATEDIASVVPKVQCVHVGRQHAHLRPALLARVGGWRRMILGEERVTEGCVLLRLCLVDRTASGRASCCVGES